MTEFDWEEWQRRREAYRARRVVTHKTCPRCRETKSVDEFYPHRSHSDGLCAYCKPCERERVRERRAKAIRRCPTCGARVKGQEHADHAAAAQH